MQVEGVTVTRIIEPKLLGVFKAHNVYLCTGKYGEYLRHNSLNYSIPEWAKMENLNEMFFLTTNCSAFRNFIHYLPIDNVDCMG